MDSHKLWKNKILTYDISRILLWSVFLCSILFLVYMKRFFNKLLNNQENKFLLNEDDTIQNLLQKHSTSKCNFLFLDFVFSFAVSTAYLCYGFWSITEIPENYVHHFEILLKLVVFIFDLFIGLLYTKSCIISYEVSSSSQETSNLYHFKGFGESALALSDGESFSEDEIYTVESRKKKQTTRENGLLYTNLSTS